MPPLYELQHLRCAFGRLEEIGPTNSPTIDNLKRILLLRIAEVENTLEKNADRGVCPSGPFKS